MRRATKVLVTIQYDGQDEIVYEFSAPDPLRFSATNEFKDKEDSESRYREVEPTGFVTLEIYGKPKNYRAPKPEAKS